MLANILIETTYNYLSGFFLMAWYLLNSKPWHCFGAKKAEGVKGRLMLVVDTSAKKRRLFFLNLLRFGSDYEGDGACVKTR